MSLAYYARNAATAERNRRRMRREGVTMNGYKLWTEEEKEIVRRLSPDYDAICKLIPSRKRRSIQHMASAMGVAGEKHLYTAAEISKLRRLYSTATWQEILEAFPFSDKERLKGVAKYHGFRRPRKKFKLTGDQPIDALLEKCAAANLSLVDLDKECRTKNYFRHCNWRSKPPNYTRIVKAIKLLEGQMRAEWPSDEF
ncbi:hypothetical protein FP026_27880 [Rhizobium tropici]|uniref:Uncharacterized protein n=1 Tax=Rhizobium tropici TaxID=398 RepID=A0A5B0VPX8_RHITR|nr:hypothetical protein [Rhizobium tropici]KAA1176464.1 hypothetical protein FP026_27880 [Rhizobium tropici]